MISGGRREAAGTVGAAFHPLLQGLVGFLFLANVLISIGAVRWMVAGIPVRSLFAVAGLILIAALEPAVLVVAIARHGRILGLIAAFAALGTVVSVLNGTEFSILGRQLMEIHLQAVVGFVFGVVVVTICGVRTAALIFLAAVGVSVAVALLQFMHVEAAWSVRQLLGNLNGDSALVRNAYSRGDRPLGISFSPVHLGTQTCLAFVAFYALRMRALGADFSHRLDSWVLATVPIVIGICVISGNRSPIVGVIVFAAIYLVIKSPRLFWGLAPLAVAAFPVILLTLHGLAEAGLRVASLSDGSALGREVLADLGWRLFVDQPLGYGLAFDSTQHWQDYWKDLQFFDNPNQIRLFAPHNFFINMLDKYGVGSLLLLPLAIPTSRAGMLAALPFVAYVLHISFHNDGPLQSDFLIWYVIAMLLPLVAAYPIRSRSNGPRPTLQVARAPARLRPSLREHSLSGRRRT